MAAVMLGPSLDQIRVKNGYGLCTSAFSASVIGRFDASSDKRKAINREWDAKYASDAVYQMSQLQGNHPIRKVLQMQKCYPETVKRLNSKRDSNDAQNKKKVSTTLCGASACNQTNNLGRKDVHRMTSRDSGDKNSGSRRACDDEYRFCRGKMEYYRTKGREAEVDGILTGESKLAAKTPLFPAHATHQQLLGLVRQPSFPHKPAPEVRRELKWLGDNVGWEENRGLPTPPAGRNAKDGEVHPWPSSQYPAVDHERYE